MQALIRHSLVQTLPISFPCIIIITIIVIIITISVVIIIIITL